MIEKLMLDYLKDELDCYVGLEIPNSPEYPYVVFEKTGSSLRDQIKESTLVFQSYDESLYKVVELNEKVKDVVLRATTLPEIASVKLNSDYNYTNVGEKGYRYQAVFNIYHY